MEQHWEEGLAPDEIKTGRWDFVVLQEQSMLGTAVSEDRKMYFGSPEPFFEYARKFERIIRKSGAETVFYMTWSREKYPQQQKYLTYAYMHIARNLTAKVAPVGMVWDQVRDNPDIDLYQEDGSHPSVYGSFLAAATLFAVIFDVGPEGIPGRLEGQEILPGGSLSAETSVLSDLSEADANIILTEVTDIHEQVKKHNGYIEVPRAVSNKKRSLLRQILSPLRTSQGQFAVLIIVTVLYLSFKVGRKVFGNKTQTQSTSPPG